MQMVGAFAEFERAMIRERTSAGLAAARAEGRIGGRRKKLAKLNCRIRSCSLDVLGKFYPCQQKCQLVQSFHNVSIQQLPL